MHFSNVLVATASLASVVVAQTTTPTSGGKPNMITNFGITTTAVQAGQQYTVQWTNKAGPSVTVSIRSGNPNALGAPTVLCGAVANSGSCKFTVPKDWTTGTSNTIEICQGSDTSNCNYSPMFAVAGGTGVAQSSGSSPSASGASESAEPTASETAGATGSAETITGTSTPTGKPKTLATSASEYATPTPSEEPTETASSTSSKSSQTGTAPSPNEGSVARSSSLAMALCVFAAVVYLN